MRLFCLALLLWSPQLANAQSVAAVDLGETPLRALLARRGNPSDTGTQNNGWRYVSYAPRGRGETFYFSPSDSIIEWVRIFPEPGRSSERVHEAFGPPDTTKFGDDLSKMEFFKHGTIMVRYTESNTVAMIDYYSEPWQRIGLRRAARAETRIDSTLATLILGMPCRTRNCPAFVKAGDSARVLRSASARVRGLVAAGKPVPADLYTVSNVYDSLCALADCPQIYRDARAFDDNP
jgi:hypothetical protein